MKEFQEEAKEILRDFIDETFAEKNINEVYDSEKKYEIFEDLTFEQETQGSDQFFKIGGSKESGKPLGKEKMIEILKAKESLEEFSDEKSQDDPQKEIQD